MKYRACLVFLILAAAVAVAAAADITISAGQSEYYFPLGQDASIPMTFANALGHPVDGTVSFTTAEQQQGGGTVMMSSQSQSFSYTVPAGESHVKLGAGSSTVEKTVRVKTSFDYADPVSMHVSLPEIVIHFTASPSSGGSQGKNPVTSTSAPGGTVSSSTGSSVQVIQQSFSTMGQSGSSGSQTGGQTDQDTQALKQQLQQEMQKAEQDKAKFRDALERDPLLSSVNASLAADGFSRQSLDASPNGSDQGSFSAQYQNDAGDTVSLAGSMENGAISSVGLTSAAPVNVTGPVASNSTYQALVQQIGAEGFSRNVTSMQIRADGAMVNITYQDQNNKKAFINATTSGGNVTGISLAKEPDKPVNLLPLAILIIAAVVIAAAAWILYRKFRNRAPPIVQKLQERLQPREPFDHKKAALDLLARAETAFSNREYPDAYGFAGQALRLFLAYEHGACREMANEDLIAFLRSRSLEDRQVWEILDRCSDVEFAKGAPDAGGFAAMVAAIRQKIH